MRFHTRTNAHRARLSSDIAHAPHSPRVHTNTRRLCRVVNIAGQATGTEAMDERVVNALDEGDDASLSVNIQKGAYTLDQALSALCNFTLCVNAAKAIGCTFSDVVTPVTLFALRTSTQQEPSRAHFNSPLPLYVSVRGAATRVA